MSLILRELRLNYGKFVGGEIKLAQGLNIIYGENEAGKSTILRFIGSIFYGQYKQNTKRLMVDKALVDKDRPWFSRSYSGSIIFEDAGQTYHLFRDFEKKEYSLQALSQGKTLDFDDPRQPGQYFFALEGPVFSNLIAIDLRDMTIDSEDRQAIKKLLVDINYKENYQLSFDRIRDDLDQAISDIGTDRLSNRELGRINRQIDQGKKALGRLGESRQKLEEEEGDLKRLRARLEAKEEELASYQSQLRYLPDKSYSDLMELFEGWKQTKDRLGSLRKKSALPVIFSLALLIISLIFESNGLMVLCLLALVISVGLYFKRLRPSEKDVMALEEEISRNFKKEGLEFTDSYEDFSSKLGEKGLDESLVQKVDALNDELLSLRQLIRDKEFAMMEDQARKKEERKLIEELSELHNKREELIKKVQAYELILQGLDHAEKKILVNFKENMEEEISQILNCLTEGRYCKVFLKEDFSLEVYSRDKQAYVDLKDLSLGTNQLISLAYRLVLNKKSSPKKLPLIFDNSLEFIDKGRQRRLLDLLYDYSQDRQIIIFTKDLEEAEGLAKLYGAWLVDLS